MEFKSTIKAHDSNPWQFIYPKSNSYWQYQNPILIGNIKAQFLLATSTLKPNSYWQHQSPIFIGNIKAQFLLAISKPNFSLTLLYQKEKSPRLSTLGKEKISCYCSKKGPLQVFMKKPKKKKCLLIKVHEE